MPKDARSNPYSHLRRLIPTRFIALAILSTALAARADTVDDLIAKRMQDRQIPGLSLAIIQDGTIVKAQGYGFADKTNKTPVTPNTLFQAGSISKPVAACAALHLVEQNRLALDTDANTQLRTWKIPENEFTKEKPVTLREILSHSAGLTIHGFRGYAIDAARPTLVQVLNGAKPANSSPIRVFLLPGSVERYSGGGYVVMQQMILDATDEPFPKFMHDTVLQPFGMTNSTYEQPPPPEMAARTATGYYTNGQPVAGRWHVYPEMAPAGLWTTPSDLARFALGIQQALAGKSNPVISQPMTRQMLTSQKENAGLGLFLQSKGNKLVFMHNGRNEGFDADLVAFARTGNGAAIMINANDDTGIIHEIIEAIGKEYHWF